MRSMVSALAAALVAGLWTGPVSADGLSVWPATQNARPGYTRVWDDDRLNPQRAGGTAAGEAQMRSIWTDTVPRALQPVPVPADPVGAAAATGNVATDGTVYQALPGVFVQVSTFPDRATAASVVADLRSAGIPARNGTLRRGSRETPVVLTGPYADSATANAALARVQQQGFPGAFLRR